MVLANDRQAIQVCIRTCTDIDPEKVRIVRIANSSEVEYIYLSEAYYDLAAAEPRFPVLTEPEVMGFDSEGNLVDLGNISG